MKVLILLLAIFVLSSHILVAAPGEASRPNVLFIAMDDLNDWIGCMGGHPQTITPNLDRLAASGVLFTNAHCPAPACNPSLSAIFTGRAPPRSGLYDNLQKMREVMPTEKIIPQFLRDHGYHAAGSGKMLHYFIDAKSWDEYFPKAASENPFPETFHPQKRPVSLERGGPWQYVETDWAALDVTDEEFGGDWSVSQWSGEQLRMTHEKPFFLACGFYRPHEPWFVPKKYFEPFPLDSIELPRGYQENDLDDVPESGQRLARNKYFAHIQQQGQWKQGIQGYLASIHFADAMLGRVLDALESGPNAKSTIVVLKIYTLACRDSRTSHGSCSQGCECCTPGRYACGIGLRCPCESVELVSNVARFVQVTCKSQLRRTKFIALTERSRGNKLEPRFDYVHGPAWILCHEWPFTSLHSLCRRQ